MQQCRAPPPSARGWRAVISLICLAVFAAAAGHVLHRARLFLRAPWRPARPAAASLRRRPRSRPTAVAARPSPCDDVATIRASASARLAISSAAAACSASARVVAAAPRRIDRSPARSRRRSCACSAVALRTCTASRVVLCAALMMSRAARPCSAIALVTSCAIFRIWPVAWTICAGAGRLLGGRGRRPACACSVVAAIAPTTVCAAVRCSSVARAIWPTSVDGLGDAAEDLLQAGRAVLGQRAALVRDAQAVVARPPPPPARLPAAP